MVSSLEGIIISLLMIGEDRDVQAILPYAKDHVKNLRQAIEDGNSEDIEINLVRLYGYLHSAGCVYSEGERAILKARNSYGCYPGGFSPLVMAGPYIDHQTVVADLGSGNGLQGLLLQRLYPHKRTIQVEISSEMIRMGRLFQKALGIDRERVEWINDDILNISLYDYDIDFLYIYLPSRPTGSGLDLYRALARNILSCNKPLYIFSIADVLRRFIREGFDIFYSDGHLTCMKRGEKD